MTHVFRASFVIISFSLLFTAFSMQAARTITVNNRQIVTGKVYDLNSLMSTSSLDDFYTIIESHTVFIDFYATWCKPCEKMSPRFKELAQEADHVLFIKINIEEFRLIAQAYGVKSLPTFISFRNGEEVAFIAKGIIPKKQLKSLSGVC